MPEPFDRLKFLASVTAAYRALNNAPGANALDALESLMQAAGHVLVETGCTAAHLDGVQQMMGQALADGWNSASADLRGLAAEQVQGHA